MGQLSEGLRLGVIFPHAAVQSADDIDRFVLGAAETGATYVSFPNHELGAERATHGSSLENDWPFALGRGDRGTPYDSRARFHEPFVLAGYLASSIRAARLDVDLVTGVVVLPQRQTVLVARQAAQVALLSGGRFVLGAGAGWNRVEFEALTDRPWNERFGVLEEQISLLRALWAEDTVDFSGEHHELTSVGLPLRPPGQRIEVAIGSGSGPASTDRVGRIADAWMPQDLPGRGLEAGLERVRRAAAAAGRDADSFDVYGVVQAGDRDHERVAVHTKRWRTAGATHVAFDLKGAPDPLHALRGAVEAVRNG